MAEKDQQRKDKAKKQTVKVNISVKNSYWKTAHYIIPNKPLQYSLAFLQFSLVKSMSCEGKDAIR